MSHGSLLQGKNLYFFLAFKQNFFSTQRATSWSNDSLWF